MEIYRNLMETIKIHYMMETFTDFFFFPFLFFFLMGPPQHSKRNINNTKSEMRHKGEFDHH